MEFRLSLNPSRLHLYFLLVAALPSLLSIFCLPGGISLLLFPCWGAAIWWGFDEWCRLPHLVKASSSVLEIQGPGGKVLIQPEVSRVQVLPWMLLVSADRSAHGAPALIWCDAMNRQEWARLRYWISVSSIQAPTHDHILAGKIDGHQNGVLGNR